VRRLILLAVTLCALALAGPASAQLDDFRNGGSVPQCKYSDRQLGQQLGDLPPDVEQYAPDYADELRNARGAPCGGSGAGGNGATSGGGPGSVEDVPVPGSGSGGGTDGGAGGGGPGSARSGGADGTSGAQVSEPPVPKPDARKRLVNASSPAVTVRPTGPDVPLWAAILAAAVLLIGSALGAMYIFGANFSRFSRPLGAAAGEARARTSDRALQLWETVRYGR
jgi:hypothetical protein